MITHDKYAYFNFTIKNLKIMTKNEVTMKNKLKQTFDL